MPKKSTTSKRAKTFKRSKKSPKWQLPLLAVLVAAAVGFGIFVVFFSQAATVGPHMYMAASNNTTDPTFTQFDFGIFGDKYVAGDWNKDGKDTLGAYRPSESTFYLTNSNSSAGVTGFQYGISGDIPIAGDWNGDGTTTVGVYRPTTGKFYLRNSNTTGNADVETLMLGNLSSTTPDKVPIACDWNGDGITDLGLFRTSTAEWETFVSYGQQANAPWIGYVPTFVYGNPGDKPVCGDWDSNKTATPGVYRDSNSTFYLKNTNDGAAGWPQRFGQIGFLPLVGRWTGTAQTLIGAYSLGGATIADPTLTTAPGGGTVPNATGACVGDLSRDIKQLQRCINSRGGNLAVDGDIGQLTRDACKAKLGAFCPTNVAGWSAGATSGANSGTSGTTAGSGSNSGAAGPLGPQAPVTQQECNNVRKDMASKLKAFVDTVDAAFQLSKKGNSFVTYDANRVNDYLNKARSDQQRLDTRNCAYYSINYVSSWSLNELIGTQLMTPEAALKDLKKVYSNGLGHVTNANEAIRQMIQNGRN